MIHVTNEEFLKAIFGDDAPWSHVTSFHDDPSEILDSRRQRCWAGGYANQTFIQPMSNQYFTISLFYCDHENKARRRKALFRQTNVIVADDVREKLPEENVRRLPPPSFKLETSPGSEQWGWILDQPCTDRAMVENLLDGLVAKGLAPAGKDPGMKGVTRYVRLPQGCNTKKAKLVDGQPVQCRMLEWNPGSKVTIQALASPFGVDLAAVRREGRVDGAADLPDHPLLDLADIIFVKDVRSDGRFDITCPWVDEHTGAADDGAAIFTNNDGSIGFKCHHGSCEQKTGKHLLDRIEQAYPRFREQLSGYKIAKTFAGVVSPAATQTEDLGQLNFLNPEPAPGKPEDVPAPPQSGESLTGISDPLQDLVNQLKRTPSNSDAAIGLALGILKAVDELPHIRRMVWHEEVRDHMVWTKADFKQVLEEERSKWYQEQNGDAAETVYSRFTFVRSIGTFFDPTVDMMLKPDYFRNGFNHLDDDILTEALVNGRCTKVDAIGYSPGFPSHYSEHGKTYVNAWDDDIDQGVPGDPKPWLDLFDVLGWSGTHKAHMLGWMAYTLQHPENKINHAMILGGGEGVGKDALMTPLMNALGRNACIITSDILKEQFNEFLFQRKLIHINELDASNYQEAAAITNKIKGYVTSPPDMLRINLKNLGAFSIKNIVNIWAGTNEAQPIKISGDSRRFFVLWSDLKIRGADGEIRADWKAYYDDFWRWLRDDHGWRICVDYLMNYDLSHFNPRTAPVVTDAMRDMQEASQDPLLGAFIHCVRAKVTLFNSDLMTVNDIYQVLRSIDLGGMGFNIRKLPSASILGKVIKQSNLTKIIRAYDKGSESKIYCIRDGDRYDRMKKSELMRQYHEQISAARSMSTLSVVNPEKKEMRL